MGGTYTAKPDASTAPVVPDGWNPEWPFPGVFPPGYTPVYSLVVTAPATASVGSTVSVSALLKDHVSYLTNEPAGSVLAWSVKVGGVAVPLRIGTGSYGATATSVYVQDTDDFWGAAPTLDIQFTEDHSGETAVLTVASTVSGVVVTETANITVSKNYKILATFEIDSQAVTGTAVATCSASARILSTHANVIAATQLSTVGYTLTDLDVTEGTEAQSSAVEDSAEISETNPDVTYTVLVAASATVLGDGSDSKSASVSGTASIVITDAATDEVIYSRTRAMSASAAIDPPDDSGSDSDSLQITFNSTTEVVTVVSP